IGQTNEKITALYCRLSVEDLKDKNGKDKSEKEKESNSITNQKQILADYAKRNGYTNTMFFVDDGISGTSFERDDFQRMQKLAEEGKVGTIIVKDLSRFGREQVEAGRLTQIVYPSLGITFISIQENVNSSTGEGMEMMPFYNIFNEWYAAQTSKKIRAVWQSKAEHGKRISPTVPFGYMKDPNDKEKWLIDEPAAEVVKKIYSLCLDGRGPAQIARQLEDERILCPSAYYDRIERKQRNTPRKNPYGWMDSTVAGILENRQYTGCAVNFKTTTVSYKVHKTIYNPVKEQQIIPNMQEPIIDEDTWLRVQELRQNKRRPTATGRTSLFSGLVFCPDCGAKLHFHAAKSLRRDQEFFCCANYKSGRGECKIHFIRDVVLQKVVREAIGNLADFVRCYEPVFLFMLAKNNDAMRQVEFKRLTKETEDGAKRLLELDRLIAKTYENNVLGKIDDDLYEKLMSQYQTEQKELTVSVAEGRKKLAETEEKKVDARRLIKMLREMTDVKELTPTIVNSLIRRIEVHNNDKYDGHCHVKVDIYFTAVGLIDIPKEEEILAMTEEIKKDPQKFRISA
ncbi:MAG: recombinase family protein, partial [Clostridiales bacterium]|nr:recombinase family protein [Clostridiales bacterium]